MKNILTGLVDRNGQPICEDEVILVGMREGDASGWTKERVVNARQGCIKVRQ